MHYITNNYGRLWDVTDLGNPLYLRWANVERITWPNRVLLSGFWPDAKDWLEWGTARTLEILYGMCKSPDIYYAESMEFRFVNAKILHCWIPQPMLWSASGNAAPIRLWLQILCDRIEVKK